METEGVHMDGNQLDDLPPKLMRNRIKFPGLVEIILLVIALLITAFLVFPVIFQAREKARCISSLSNLRTLNGAIAFYVQDTGHFPGLNWHADLEAIGSDRRCFHNPESTPDNQSTDISYGYNSLLIRNDGSGVAATAVVHPMDVGVLADAQPLRPWKDGGGIIGADHRWRSRQVTPHIISYWVEAHTDKPHHTAGVSIGYADGHSKYFPCTEADLADANHPVNQAFFGAKKLGYVK